MFMLLFETRPHYFLWLSRTHYLDQPGLKLNRDPPASDS